MKIKTIFVALIILLLTQTANAQYGQVNELAMRLSSEAGAFAEANYNSYRNSFRSSRTDVEAVMLAHQFSVATQLFNRMVNDRRRNQDLRDAFQLLQDLARSVERNNLQRSAWFNVQRLMMDVGRELNLDTSSDNQYPPGRPTSGRMTWRGRVDDDVRITIRGGTADVETIGGTPYNNASPNFTASLPPRRVNVNLQVKKGRGEVFIEQQPSRENNYAAVVRIRDPRGGASDYEFELSW
jgi:type II secretory pathway pseudopilin PulG